MNLKEYININKQQDEQFNIYMNLLLEWNEKINLTAITQRDEIILKHFIDSLTISKYLKNNQKIIDIGTGAGFPGIPIKIYNNTLSITLLDSLNKRINFLNEVINTLSLENIETIHGRAEDFGQNKKYREKYDIATSRAVANMSTLLEYLMPFVKVGGFCICMKGSNIKEELDQAKSAIEKLGGKLEKVDKLNLGNTEIERNIIIIKKIKSTPRIYPRKAGTPAKNPI